jgi:hypothetical protein
MRPKCPVLFQFLSPLSSRLRPKTSPNFILKILSIVSKTARVFVTNGHLREGADLGDQHISHVAWLAGRVLGHSGRGPPHSRTLARTSNAPLAAKSSGLRPNPPPERRDGGKVHTGGWTDTTSDRAIDPCFSVGPHLRMHTRRRRSDVAPTLIDSSPLGTVRHRLLASVLSVNSVGVSDSPTRSVGPALRWPPRTAQRAIPTKTTALPPRWGCRVTDLSAEALAKAETQRGRFGTPQPVAPALRFAGRRGRRSAPSLPNQAPVPAKSKRATTNAHPRFLICVHLGPSVVEISVPGLGRIREIRVPVVRQGREEIGSARSVF